MTDQETTPEITESTENIESTSEDTSSSEEVSSEENSEESSQEAVSEESQEEEPSKEESSTEEEKVEEAVRTWKMKVMGEEREFDEKALLDNMDEILKFAQLGESAHKKFNEASQMRKESEELIKLIKENPAAVLSDPRIGVDLKKFAEDVLTQEIEDMKKTPEQKEKEKLQNDLEEAKKALETAQEEKRKNEFQRLQDEEAAKLEDEMLGAIETSGLPKNPYVIRRMADYMLLAMQNDVDLSPQDVLPLVQKELKQDIRDLFASSPEQVMDELLGKETISNIRQRHIKQMKKPVETANNIKESGNNTKPTEEDSDKKISMRDFMDGNF
jgi:hypothetical protein